jgi:uncharacterized membrane protein
MSIAVDTSLNSKNTDSNFITFDLIGRTFRVNRYYILLLIVLIGALLRFYKLDFQGLWYDEIHSMNGSDPDLTIKQILEYSKTDQPPASFLLLHFWFKIFPFNDFSGRLFSAIIGLLGIVAMYFLGTEIKDSRIGLTTAFLTSINYFHLYYSQEVRFYIFLFLVATLSFLFFVKAMRTKKPIHFALYVLFTVVAFYTHYF